MAQRGCVPCFGFGSLFLAKVLGSALLEVLLEVRADVNVVCCCCTASTLGANEPYVGITDPVLDLAVE